MRGGGSSCRSFLIDGAIRTGQVLLHVMPAGSLEGSFHFSRGAALSSAIGVSSVFVWFGGVWGSVDDDGRSRPLRESGRSTRMDSASGIVSRTLIPPNCLVQRSEITRSGFFLRRLAARPVGTTGRTSRASCANWPARRQRKISVTLEDPTEG